MLLFIEVSSTALTLLLTLVAPLRNWLNSTKSLKRLRVFNFNLEYETFCHLMPPKLFKNFSCIKQKPSVDWIDFFNLLSEYFTIYFFIHYRGFPNNIKYMKVSVIFSMFNVLVIWLWFKVENICDMSILMYNLPHCLLERLYSLASGIFFSSGKIHSVSFIEISILWVEDVFSRSFARPSFKWGVAWLALFLFVRATAKFYLKTCE